MRTLLKHYNEAEQTVDRDIIGNVLINIPHPAMFKRNRQLSR